MTREGLDEDLFKYVDDYAAKISDGEVDESEDFDPDWDIFTFCQLFFDQFFSQFGGKSIRGFTQRSREAATLLIETLRLSGQGSPQARELVVLYEEFCDMSDNTSKGYGAPTPITVQTFHEDYLERLLAAAIEWALSENAASLSTRIEQSLARYLTARGANS